MDDRTVLLLVCLWGSWSGSGSTCDGRGRWWKGMHRCRAGRGGGGRVCLISTVGGRRGGGLPRNAVVLAVAVGHGSRRGALRCGSS